MSYKIEKNALEIQSEPHNISVKINYTNIIF